MSKKLTIKAALQLAQSRTESLDAQVLLGAVLKVERAYLLAHPEAVLSDDQAAQYLSQLERLAAGEPLPYLLGRRAFYDREFWVSPDVLIPRPETELLVQTAITWAQKKTKLMAVDVGTGSGALAVTFAANVPAAHVVAVDVSPAALDIARRNAEQQGVSVTFFQGDLLQPLLAANLRFDLLLANLPYIASDVVLGLDVSCYEPHLALDGGADGLDLVRQLLAQAPRLANPGALLLLEIGADQGAAAADLAQQTFPQAAVQIEPDLAGLDRMVRIQLGD
ncbi:MAG TPA: peptide chain release factor N(5)-glutamine methyltransferase [Phototrophicaceae bacterium]|nr:peptide chain release factor N(5)-glutamine methyltransferase [Phototrophicaceae bacterium]